MRLRALSVQDFGAVRSADVSFEDGLNVLHGPNDLGKSTLASAIRAALLLQHGSSGARPFIPWGTTRKPTVTLTFEVEGRLWRVHKVFGSSSGGKSVLEWSNDGTTWGLEEEGRGVDGRVRELLQWGLAAPGGRGGAHGFPKSFLATVLLGEQALPYRLLEQSLEGDAEDTGKTRLIEALQAMATDPVYQDVLLQAQARVDEAFTSKGKRSTRKGSPFERVASEIKQRRETSEQLAAQVAESDAVISRLGDLSARRDRVLTERSAAAQRVEQLQEALDRAKARARLQAEVDAARATLREIERNQEEIARLQTELSSAEAALPTAEAAVESAATKGRAAAQAKAQARADVDVLARGGDAEQRAQEQAHEEAIRTLEAEAAALEQAAAKLEIWRAAAQEHAAAQEAQSKAQAQLEAASQARALAEQEAKAVAETHRQLQDAQRWAHAQRLSDRLCVLTQRASAAEAARTEAAAARTAARALGAELEEAFPDAAALAVIEQAWNALQVSEAALQGGFRVALDLRRAANARVDGVDTKIGDGATDLDAEREVVLEIGEVGTVTVRPGDPSAHASVEAARDAWQPHGSTLERLGLALVDALREAARERAAKLERRKALLRDAELLEAKATPPEPQEVETLRRELEGAQRELDAAAPNACRSLAEAHGEDLDAAVREAEAEAEAAQGRVATALAQTSEARTELRLATQTLEAAAKAELAARTEGDDPKTVSAALDARRVSLHARQEELVERTKAQADATARRVETVQRALTEAEDAVETATAQEAEARRALEAARAAKTSAQAALEVRREQAQHHDPLLAAERVAQAEDALAAHRAPTEDLSDEAVAEVHAALQQAEEALEDAERAVRQQEGALQQVGGQVVRERAQMAREALDEAMRQEAEVELDYDGWKLLLSTLREVENETGAHLGRALDEELAGRLRALSQGRYQGASLGADLETEGVVTAQGVQALERFSEGVKEQVATLLRVSVAEHLGTMLLLDDHLAQTDPARAEWFRSLLRESAEGIQIVVLTCRPADYVGDGDDAVRVVDLGATVSRV